MHHDAVGEEDRVLLVDDLIATGGTAAAAVTLLRKAKAKVVGASFVIDLQDMGGSQLLKASKCDVLTLCSFEGD